MIVLAGNIAANTTIIPDTISVAFAFPEWISNKIHPVIASYLELRTQYAYASDGASEPFKVLLTKMSNGSLKIISYDSSLISTDKGFRIQFDLLIDTD